MAYIYTILVIIVMLIIASTVVRKRTYKEVDRLEEWKNDIENRSIPEEIGKVKQLQMSGQTEEKFEEWRSEWDEIVGVIIPDIGERLFDIEDHAVKNRFKKAKQLIVHTDQRLNGVEQQLAQILDEIQQLVQSEEQNRTEISDVREGYKQLSAELMKKRGSLGEGLSLFDEKIEKVNELLNAFDQATIDGSYLQARENLIEANALLLETESLIERYPTLLVQITLTIPAEVDQLCEGIIEMENVGYHLEPFLLSPRIDSFREELLQLKEKMMELKCDEAEQQMVELLEQIERVYETLDHEVDSKQHVSTELPKLREQAVQVDEQIHTLLIETVQVQKSYYIPKEQLKAQGQMRENALDLSNQLHVIADVSDNNKQTFTTIHELIEEWKERMTKLQVAVGKDKESLYKLREEEWKAQETLRGLRDKLLETKRIVQKSNIPGLPERSLTQLERAERKLIEASSQLDQVPLELGRVAVLVGEASTEVHENEEMIKDTIQLAALAERVIQFGNRYRSRSQTVEAGLLESERHFRECEYEEAIECAERAIHVYEPNVLDRLEESIRA